MNYLFPPPLSITGPFRAKCLCYPLFYFSTLLSPLSTVSYSFIMFARYFQVSEWAPSPLQKKCDIIYRWHLQLYLSVNTRSIQFANFAIRFKVFNNFHLIKLSFLPKFPAIISITIYSDICLDSLVRHSHWWWSTHKSIKLLPTKTLESSADNNM